MVKQNHSKDTDLKISSVSYQLRINNDQLEEHQKSKILNEIKTLVVEAEFILQEKSQNNQDVYQLSLSSPVREIKMLSGRGACTLATTEKLKDQDSYQLKFKCLRTSKGDFQLKVAYQIAVNKIVGYDLVTEGERQYHLVYLPATLGKEVFIGFNEDYEFPRQVTLTGHKRLKIFGHGLLKTTEFTAEYPPTSDQSKDKETAEIKLTWRNTETDSSYPLFFGFGSWEQPDRFSLQLKLKHQTGAIEKVKRNSLMITPLGSQHHRVGKRSLKSLQIKIIQNHANNLKPLSTKSGRNGESINQFIDDERPLIWIILPDHPEYTPPDLREYGVIFIDESWFYRYERFGYAMPRWDQLLMFKNLYVSLQAQLLSQSDYNFLKVISWWRALTHLNDRNTANTMSDQYAVYQTRELENQASIYQGLSTSSTHSYELIFGGTMRMITSWLKHKKSYKNNSQRIDQKVNLAIGESLVSENLSDKAFLNRLTIFGRQLNHLDSHLKQILESYMSNTGLPLVYVKWKQQKRGDSYDIRFTISQRPFAPGREISQLNPAMWIIPICLKLGIKDNPARKHCVLLDQPEASHYELTLEAPLEWVHPNLDQSGLYLWSLDQPAFNALLKAKGLDLTEFLSLSEMSAALLETPQGSPMTYLKSVKELAGAQNHPLSLDLLFTHLNQVVHYFGSQSQKSGCTELWASTILDAVMISKPHFDEAPLKHLTRLQLAQWDRRSISSTQIQKMLPKKERVMIKKFLRPTSSQEAIEDDVAKVELDIIQYPLLLKALAGRQKLWDQLYQKLAESEDQPLARLLIIQALVQFIEPDLFKQTLDLLSNSDQVEGRMDNLSAGSESTEQREEQRAKNTGPDSQQTVPTDDSIAHEEIDHAETNEEENEGLKVGLRAEDALELIRGVRSQRAKKIAWKWLLDKGDHVTEAIFFGQRSDIQLALLEWSDVVCDPAGLKRLESIFKGQFGFKQSTLERSRKHLRAARKCVRLNALQAGVRTWIKGSLGTCN